jgi:hypothetical protein
VQTIVGKQQFAEYNELLGITALKVVYYPQLGYQIAIPRSVATDQEALKQQLFEYQFVTEQFVYYKNPCVRELDNEIGGMLQLSR